MKLINKIPFWLKSKYLIALGVFVAIMLFIDKNDIFTQYTRTQQLKELQQSKDYYTARIATERKELEQLRTDPGTLEKYAREKYLMKRENEDLFLVLENPVKGE